MVKVRLNPRLCELTSLEFSWLTATEMQTQLCLNKI